jgi:hypothetical protein
MEGVDPKGKEALAAAARAFARAQKQGLVWVNAQTGLFECEQEQLCPPTPKWVNTDQLNF